MPKTPSAQPTARPVFLYALIGALVLVAAVPFVVVAFQTWLANESLIDQAQHSHLIMAKTGASRISYRLNALDEVVTALAANPQLYDEPNSKAAQEALAGALVGRSQLLAVATFYRDEERDILVQMARRPDAAWVNAEQLIQAGSSFAVVGSADQAITLMRPSGRPGLRVVAAIDAAGLSSDLSPIESGGTSLALKARNGAGHLSLGPEIPDPVSHLADNNSLASGASRFELAGRTLIGAFAVVPNSPWVVYSVQPAEDAERARAQMRSAALYAVIAVSSLVALLSLAAWRWLLLPVRKLLAMQRRVLGGSGSAASDDAGELRESFMRLEAMAEDRDAFERIFLDRYQVIRVLGHGAMGSVFRAWDPRLCRDVAIKTIRLAGPNVIDEVVLQLSLQNEAVAIARLQHANVVSVYDYLVRDEFAFIVMEFVEGANLRGILSAAGRLSEGETMAVAVAVLRALVVAHQEGFLHRDIKPANVLISLDAEVKLGDFGVAVRRSELEEGADGSAVGTPGYIAPECLYGAAASERSDLYALGVMLRECLTGIRPDAKRPRQSTDVADDRWSGATVSTSFRKWIDGLISVNAEDRPSRASDALKTCPATDLDAAFTALASRIVHVGNAVTPDDARPTRLTEEKIA